MLSGTHPAFYPHLHHSRPRITGNAQHVLKLAKSTFTLFVQQPIKAYLVAEKMELTFIMYSRLLRLPSIDRGTSQPFKLPSMIQSSLHCHRNLHCTFPAYAKNNIAEVFVYIPWYALVLKPLHRPSLLAELFICPHYGIRLQRLHKLECNSGDTLLYSLDLRRSPDFAPLHSRAAIQRSSLSTKSAQRSNLGPRSQNPDIVLTHRLGKMVQDIWRDRPSECARQPDDSSEHAVCDSRALGEERG